MKAQLALAGAALVLLVPSLSSRHSTLHAQGSLTPPGAPAPLFKTLDQVEARTIVDSNNTPGDATTLFRITNPGSYYLTGNLTGVSNKHGIVIAAPNVALDLNGFALLGVAGSLDGINAVNATALASGLAVRNGTVAGWGGNGIAALPGAPDSRFSNLRLLSNALNGLTATNALISDCIVNGNTSDGFTNYAINANRSHIVNCIVRANYNGIQGGGGSVIESCEAADNKFGIQAANSTVLNCTVFNSSFDGMYLFNNNRITGNLVNGNNSATNGIELAAGSRGNVLDGNILLGNTTAGINLTNSGVTNNLVIRNTARGNGTNYLVGTNNSFGPIVNASGDLSTNASSAHPWANFSY